MSQYHAYSSDPAMYMFSFQVLPQRVYLSSDVSSGNLVPRIARVWETYTLRSTNYNYRAVQRHHSIYRRTARGFRGSQCTNRICSWCKHFNDVNNSEFCSPRNLWKKFGPSSDPTERRAWPGSKPFDILMVFLKLFFETVDLEKISRRQKSWKVTQLAKLNVTKLPIGLGINHLAMCSAFSILRFLTFWNTHTRTHALPPPIVSLDIFYCHKKQVICFTSWCNIVTYMYDPPCDRWQYKANVS